MRPSSATAAAASPELGARIKARREAKGLSQRATAEELGITRRQIQNWENGTSGITWANLDRIAELLDASTDWLRLGDEGLDQLAELAQPRRGPRPMNTRILQALHDIAGRLERIETTLGVATPSAGGALPPPEGELGRQLRERETSERDPARSGSARGKGSRRGSA